MGLESHVCGELEGWILDKMNSSRRGFFSPLVNEVWVFWVFSIVFWHLNGIWYLL